MQENKISIIVPVYKVEKYLRKCVDSLLNQTYTNLEIILVDDGSPDSCPQICDEYAKRDQRVKVVHKTNEGVSRARNAGLKIATGDFIGFVDSDDFVDATMYEKLLNSILENGSDIAMCGFVNIYEDGTKEKVVETNLNNVTSSNIFNFYVLNNTYKKEDAICIDGIMAFVCRVLYSKDIINEQYFNENIKYCEDLLFNVKVINKETKISIVNEGLYYYYQRGDSAIHKINERNILAKLDYLDEITPILKQKLDSEFYSIFQFAIYKIIYLDLLRSGSKELYNKYIKKLNQKKLNSKQNYKIFKSQQTGLKNKFLAFLIYHNSSMLIKLLLKVKK